MIAASTLFSISAPFAPRPLLQIDAPRSLRQEQTKRWSAPLRIMGPPQAPQDSLPLRRCLERTEARDEDLLGPNLFWA
ncbi:hypothetical protein NI454_12635 [Brevundimonas diminuta]|nr:hypothetical protein [Brevundimonas diminuta]MCO8030793.1 hypothetical protein [Brevundimonas diminuta]